MIGTETLLAFLIVTATTSIVPGPSMMFVMGQAIWRGPRSGWAALMGMQVGYFVWWAFAALGLDALASAYPLAFRLLAIAGVAYLAWLGIKAIRHSVHADEDEGDAPQRKVSNHAFRDGIAVAIVAVARPFLAAAAMYALVISLPVLSTWVLVELVWRAGVGAASYPAILWLLWLVSGRPDSSEAEFLRVAGRNLRRR